MHLAVGIQMAADREHRGRRDALRFAVRAQVDQRHARRLRVRRRAAAAAIATAAGAAPGASVSSDGVAEPSTTGMPSRCARTIARSRAE